MKSIHKVTLLIADEQRVKLPTIARAVAVQVQRGYISMWAEVETSAPLRTYQVLTRGTGHPVPSGYAYLGTYQIDDGALVFHVYVEPDLTFPILGPQKEMQS